MRPSTDVPTAFPLSNNRGIALFIALMMTLLLTLVVVALSYRVGLFAIGTRDYVIKSQSLYTAEIGLNQARYLMMASDCLPPNWNACIPGINKNTFTNLSSNIKSVFSTSMPAFTVAGEQFNFDLKGSMTHGASDRYDYKIYVKETNIPKLINVMAVSERPGMQAQTVIDAGLIFTKPIGSGYKQLGQGSEREGITGESLGVNSTTDRANF